MSVRENLIAARALIDTPEKWSKGAIKSGGCLCAMGAVGEIITTPEGWISDTKEYQALVRALPGDRVSVPSFNDEPETTHADIMALFDRAIAAQPEGKPADGSEDGAYWMNGDFQ